MVANKKHPSANQLTYPNFPSKWVRNDKKKQWKKKMKAWQYNRKVVLYSSIKWRKVFFTHFSKFCQSLENIQGYQNVQRPCLWDIQRSMSCYETSRKLQQVLWLYRWICILGISPTILWSNKSMKIMAILRIKRKKA